MTVEAQQDVVVFLGPSLSRKRAAAIFGGRYLPPARQSDIATLVAGSDPPKIIALIDGEFGQSLSVWHKEIIAALDSGIAVFGASSMGALRAAELSSFGMIGIGRVFDYYKDVLIDGDDEVALIYGPEEVDFVNLTVPFINIRATFDSLVEREIYKSEAISDMVMQLRNIPFWSRTYEAVLDVIRTQQGSSAATFFQQHYIDQKSNDAELLLRTLLVTQAAVCQSERGQELRYTTYCSDVQNQQDRRIASTPNAPSFRDIAKLIALNHDRFHEISFAAMNQSLVQVLAQITGVTAEPKDVQQEIERFQARERMTETEFRHWITANDLTEKDAQRLFYELAICRRLHRWLLLQQADKENTTFILNQVRLRGDYVSWRRRAVARASLLLDYGHLAGGDDFTSANDLLTLLTRHLANSALVIDTELSVWLEDSAFQGTLDLHRELWEGYRSRMVSERLAAQLLDEHPDVTSGNDL